MPGYDNSTHQVEKTTDAILLEIRSVGDQCNQRVGAFDDPQRDGVLFQSPALLPGEFQLSPAPLQDQPLLSLVEFHSDGEFQLSSLNNTDAWDGDGGVGCERSTLEAYAPITDNDNDGSTSSFGSSIKQMGEGLDDDDDDDDETQNGREREVSCVGGRAAQKQAKREWRQKAKAGDAEGAFAGSMSHVTALGGSSNMEEILLLPPAPMLGSKHRSSNEWVAPLINLMGGMQSDEPSPNNVTKKPVTNKRNDLRSGKRNLMSSWCNNVHTQQEENKISSWIDHVPNTSPHGVFSPPSSSVVSPTLSVGDSNCSHSLLSDSSSFVRGLRGAIDSSRSCDGEHHHHHSTTPIRPRDAINAIHKYRAKNADVDVSHSNSMNGVSSSIPAALFQQGATPSTSSINQNVSQCHISSTINAAVQNRRVVCLSDASPESPCAFGIRTQPIPQPKSTNRKSAVSAVTLNECVYNLDHWDEEVLGRFVVPTDNVADLEAHICQHPENEVSPMTTVDGGQHHRRNSGILVLLKTEATPPPPPHDAAVVVSPTCSQQRLILRSNRAVTTEEVNSEEDEETNNNNDNGVGDAFLRIGGVGCRCTPDTSAQQPP